MKLTVVGCSGSFPGPDSPASCYLVTACDEDREWRIVLDLGNGAFGALQRHVNPFDLDAVFLSHLHPDHCVDVLSLYVHRKYHPTRTGSVATLPVHGPSTSARDLESMFHGAQEGGLTTQLDIRAVSDGRRIDVGPFQITPYAVNHPVEAYGYRVEAGGRVLAFTGDTDATPALRPLLRGADLALMDCAFVDGRDDLRDVHLSGSRAATAAQEAGVRGRVVLTHLPAWNDPDVCLAQARSVWAGSPDLLGVVEADAVYDV